MNEDSPPANLLRAPLSFLSLLAALTALILLLSVAGIIWSLDGSGSPFRLSVLRQQWLVWLPFAPLAWTAWLLLQSRSRVRELERALALHRAQAEKTDARLSQCSRKVRQAERAKSEFLAAMSHELRTPLNAIIGFSEILTSEMLGPLGRDEYREYSDDIRDSGYQLLRVINDILDLSRAQSGGIDLHLSPLDVPDVVSAALDDLREEAEHRAVTLETELPGGLEPLVGDERRVRQMLTHLISNGIKFTPEGGTVTVSARSEAESVVITVADTGIGIAPEHIERALTPFGQVDGTRGRKRQGTGLGLPLTRSLVTLHGGTFDIASAPERGTLVTLSFPRHPAVQGTAAA